jgi:hypothetical protein
MITPTSSKHYMVASKDTTSTSPTRLGTAPQNRDSNSCSSTRQAFTDPDLSPNRQLQPMSKYVAPRQRKQGSSRRREWKATEGGRWAIINTTATRVVDVLMDLADKAGLSDIWGYAVRYLSRAVPRMDDLLLPGGPPLGVPLCKNGV